MTTAGLRDNQEPADLFVTDFYPQLGEYLAAQHGAGYDAAPWGWPASGPGSASTRRRTTLTRSREYLKQVSKIPGLTAEQEAELAKRIEAGLRRASWPRAATAWPRASASTGVVAEVGPGPGTTCWRPTGAGGAVASRSACRGMPFLDLIQEGNPGLIRRSRLRPHQALPAPRTPLVDREAITLEVPCR